MTVKDFVTGVFTDNGNPSSSRIFGAVCALTACVSLLYVVFKTSHIPEMGALGGLSAFGTAHYLVNRASTVTDNATSNVVKSASDAASQTAKDSKS